MCISWQIPCDISSSHGVDIKVRSPVFWNVTPCRERMNLPLWQKRLSHIPTVKTHGSVNTKLEIVPDHTVSHKTVIFSVDNSFDKNSLFFLSRQ